MATTPRYALPYPVGTDRVMDGDNAIQALAERVEAISQRVMGLATVTAPQAGIGSAVFDLPGMFVTFTAVAGHLYRATLYCITGHVTTAGREDVFIREGAVTMQGGSKDVGAGGFMVYTIVWLGTLTAGAHTLKASMDTNAGTVTMAASPTSPAHLLVEDLGV